MNNPRWCVVLLASLLMLFPVLDARRAGAAVVGDSDFAEIATVGDQAVPLRNAALAFAPRLACASRPEPIIESN